MAGQDPCDVSSGEISYKRQRSGSDSPDSRTTSSDNQNRAPPPSYKAAVAPPTDGPPGVCENAPTIILEKEDISIGVKEGCPSIRFSKKIKEQLNQRWGNAVIIKIMGTRFNFNFFLHKLQQKWNHLKGQWKLMDVENDCYIVSFDLLEDLEYVLCNGPWVVASYYLAIQRWKSDFNSYTDKITKLHVWIRLVGLRSQWFDNEILNALGNLIGSTHKVDFRTSMRARGQFARICIELDISKPLINKIEVEGEWVLIQYEGLHLVCFGCGVYGHDNAHCMKGPPKSSAAASPTKNPTGYSHEEAIETMKKLEEEKHAREEEEEKAKYANLNKWNLVQTKRQATRQRQRDSHGYYNQRVNIDPNTYIARQAGTTTLDVVKNKGKASAAVQAPPKQKYLNREKLIIGNNSSNAQAKKRYHSTNFGDVLVTPSSSSESPNQAPYFKYTPCSQSRTAKGVQIHKFTPPSSQDREKVPSASESLGEDELDAIRSAEAHEVTMRDIVIYNQADAASAMEGVIADQPTPPT